MSQRLERRRILSGLSTVPGPRCMTSATNVSGLGCTGVLSIAVLQRQDCGHRPPRFCSRKRTCFRTVLYPEASAKCKEILHTWGFCFIRLHVSVSSRQTGCAFIFPSFALSGNNFCLHSASIGFALPTLLSPPLHLYGVQIKADERTHGIVLHETEGPAGSRSAVYAKVACHGHGDEPYGYGARFCCRRG